MSTRSPAWSPLLDASEPTPGVWELHHAMEPHGPYARIALRRVQGGQLRYRVEVHGELIGWATCLSVAAEHAWSAWVDSGQRRRWEGGYG